MRRLGIALVLVGSFLLTTAAMFAWYAPDQLQRTPLDVDSTTRLSGEALVGADAAVPVKATSVTRTNSKKSTSDVSVWVTSSCLVRDQGDVPNCVSADDPEDRLLSASTDDFATDRRTGLAVNDAKYLPADATPHEGLVNKWPFNAEKKTYPYWDGTIGSAVDAEFTGTVKLEGLEAYRYETDTQDAPITVTEGVSGTYSSTKTFLIDPKTGAILKQTEHQERVTDAGDNFLTLDIEFTPDQVKANVKDAKANISKLRLALTIVPLVGLVLGLPSLIAGVVLLLRDRGRSQHKAA